VKILEAVDRREMTYRQIGTPTIAKGTLDQVGVVEGGLVCPIRSRILFSFPGKHLLDLLQSIGVVLVLRIIRIDYFLLRVG
jgi:hypothetical protein